MADLPESLRFQNMSNPSSSKMYSFKTQPVSSSQSHVRFEVRSQGIMSSNGIFQFSAKPGFNGACFPMLIGCKSLIERATLSTASGKVIMDNKYFADKQVCEQPFRSNDYLNFKAPFLDMSYFGFTLPNKLEVQADVAGTIHPSVVNPNIAGSILTSRAPTRLPNAGADITNSQTVQVTLTELFPLLFNQQLPVGSLEQLYIDIYFKKDSEEGDVFVRASANPYVSTQSPVNLTDCFLFTDHITYDDPSIQEEIENRLESNLTFTYTDTITQVVNVPAPGGAVTSDEFEADLGCIKYKLVDIRNIAKDGLAGASKNFFGKYYSLGDYTQRNINLVINDSQIFPNNSQNMGEVYSRLVKIYDTPAQIPRQVYSLSNAVGGGAGQANNGFPTVQTMNTFTQEELAGGGNIQAIELQDEMNKPLQNGNTPIRLLYKRANSTAKGTFNNAEKNYFFVNYLRSFSVSASGNIMVSEYI